MFAVHGDVEKMQKILDQKWDDAVQEQKEKLPGSDFKLYDVVDI